MISHKCGLFNNYALRLLTCGMGAATGQLIGVATFTQAVVPWQIGVAVFLLSAVTMTRTSRQARWLLVLTTPWFGYALALTWQANVIGPEAVLCALSFLALVANAWLMLGPDRRQPARGWVRFADGVEEPLKLVPVACRCCDALHVKAFGDGTKVLLTGRGDYTVVIEPPCKDVRVALHDHVDEAGNMWVLPLPMDVAT